MKIVYLTAGAAGMFCGSCMADNALAKALIRRGHECTLVPVYTPIRTDEESVSVDRVYFGGINVYLQQKLPWLRYLPRWLDGLLNRPGLIRRLTANTGQTSPDFLGAMTVSMLQGSRGRQAKELERLVQWLADDVKPDVLVLTNMLIGGGIPEWKRRLGCPIWVTLQGDDIYLDFLPEPHRTRATQAMRELVPQVDGFLVHSRFYGQRMAERLAIAPTAWHVVPLGIETRDFARPEVVNSAVEDVPTPCIGYLARLAPEKGLHQLVDAYLKLVQDPADAATRLAIAGWLGPQHETYWQDLARRLEAGAPRERWRYWGSVDRAGKLEFFRQCDVLCVPTTYEEPKGLFVLEAAAAGVPYVLPDHGAFPELHARLEHGWLYRADDQDDLVAKLKMALAAPRRLTAPQRAALVERVSIDATAAAVEQCLKFARPSRSPSHLA